MPAKFVCLASVLLMYILTACSGSTESENAQHIIDSSRKSYLTPAVSRNGVAAAMGKLKFLPTGVARDFQVCTAYTIFIFQ